MAKNITRLENMIQNVQNQNLRDMASLGELARKIIELERRIEQSDMEIYELKKGVFNGSDHGGGEFCKSKR